MGANEVSEIKRLEQLIDQNIRATRGLSEKVHELSESLRVVEVNRIHDKELADRTSVQIDKLTQAINSLNETFATINGKTQGVSSTLKAFWTIAGLIITSSILYAATAIVELQTQVAVLQSRVESK